MRTARELRVSLCASPVRSVALNALFLAPGESGGPETYLRGLVPALAREYPGLDLICSLREAAPERLRAEGWEDLVRLAPAAGERAPASAPPTQRADPRCRVAARRAGAQVLHNLASTGPALTPGLATVLTLHDVTFMRMKTFGRATTWGMARVVSLAARDADALIAVSAAARDEICASSASNRGNFCVVRHGVEHRAKGLLPRMRPPCARALGLDGRRLVLCVGALRPAQEPGAARASQPLLPDDVKVVLAGHQEPYARRVASARRANSAVEDRVGLAGYLPASRLERLWLMAACAAFPTRAEGFGMPLLEAMARGVPVACSDLPVLREVGGDVPSYFDPCDPRAAAEAISAALARPRAGQPRERPGRPGSRGARRRGARWRLTTRARRPASVARADGIPLLARTAGLLARRDASLPAGHGAAGRRLRRRLAGRSLRALHGRRLSPRPSRPAARRVGR